MLLSSRRYLSSSVYGEMRYLRTSLRDGLLVFCTEAALIAAGISKNKQIFTLSISMVWEWALPHESDSSLTALQPIYFKEVTFGSQLLTKQALIEIAEQSAIELHKCLLGKETIYGSSQEPLLQMVLQMRMDLQS